MNPHTMQQKMLVFGWPAAAAGPSASVQVDVRNFCRLHQAPAPSARCGGARVQGNCARAKLRGVQLQWAARCPGPGAGAAAITVMSVSMICSAIKYTGYQDTHSRQIWRTSTEMKRVSGLGFRFNSFPLNSKYLGTIEKCNACYLSGGHAAQDKGGGPRHSMLPVLWRHHFKLVFLHV